MITCEPSASVMVAPARWAMERITSAPAALSPVATTAQVGRDFQAGGPEGSDEGWLRDRALGCGHYGGLFARQVGGERIVEFRGIDREFSGRLGAVPCRILQRDLCRHEDAVPRRGFYFAESLAFLGGEGGDEDEPGDVVGVGGGIRDHRTSVRVADGEHAAGNLLEEAGQVCRIVSDAAQRNRGRRHLDSGGL